MKNTTLTKIVLVILIGLIILISGKVMAIEEIDNSLDLMNLFANNNSTDINNNNTPNTNNNTPNTLNALDTSGLINNNTNNNENTNIPHVGIEDNIVPMGLMLVVFGMSAVYAYNKLQHYKNI